MIFCTLKGGLGNQLFQFGAALRLARGDSSRIRFVPPKAGAFNLRLLDLFRVEIPALINYDEMLDGLGGEKIALIIDHPLSPHADQQQLDFDVASFPAVILDGYFQNCKSIKALRNFVVEGGGSQVVFDLPADKKSNACGVHYRMGDYQREDVQKEIGLLNPAYIDRCLARFLRLGEMVDIFTEQYLHNPLFSLVKK